MNLEHFTQKAQESIVAAQRDDGGAERGGNMIERFKGFFFASARGGK